MIEVKGDFWEVRQSKPNENYFIPTNTVIKANGEGVMGAGMAKQARTMYPWLPIHLGYILRTYGEVVKKLDRETKLYTFPTKHHYKDPSDLHLIRISLYQAYVVSLMTKKDCYIPRPGCGYGGLDWKSEVKPLCKVYGDWLHIVSKEDD